MPVLLFLKKKSCSNDRVKLESQPQDLCVEGETAVVACINHVQVVRGGKVVSTLEVKYEPQVRKRRQAMAVNQHYSAHNLHFFFTPQYRLCLNGQAARLWLLAARTSPFTFTRLPATT